MERRQTKLTRKYLPVEVTEQILHRLRVKDVLKFRSVCKAWKTLIDSHSFKLDHFKSAANSSTLIWRGSLSPDTGDRIRHSLLLLFPDDDSYKTTPSAALPIGKNVFVPPFPLYTRIVGNNFELFGVVNGLVCLGYYKTWMIIWNPCTREFRYTNPPSLYHLLEHIRLSGKSNQVIIEGASVCAFGFDPKTEDYKFLVTKFTNYGKAAAMIYSMRRDCWNVCTLDFPYFIYVRGADGYLDGCFYWFGLGSDGPRPCEIVKFDFNLERFDFIPFSGELAGVVERNSVVVTTRGCLELITMIKGDNESRHYEIWEMGRDDGIWSRKIRVGLSPDMGSTPLGITKDGQIICEEIKRYRGCNKVTLFNPATGSCKILHEAIDDDDDDDDDSYKFPVLTFVESLFSISL